MHGRITLRTVVSANPGISLSTPTAVAIAMLVQLHYYFTDCLMLRGEFGSAQSSPWGYMHQVSQSDSCGIGQAGKIVRPVDSGPRGSLVGIGQLTEKPEIQKA